MRVETVHSAGPYPTSVSPSVPSSRVEVGRDRTPFDSTFFGQEPKRRDRAYAHALRQVLSLREIEQSLRARPQARRIDGLRLPPRAKRDFGDRAKQGPTFARVDLPQNFTETLVSGVRVVRERKRFQGDERDWTSFFESFEQAPRPLSIRQTPQIHGICAAGPTPEPVFHSPAFAGWPRAES